MKVLFQSRIDLYNPRGGDTFQMEQTKYAIEKLDPTIRVDIDNSLNNPDIEDYDLVHLFNLDWICETYIQAKWAKKHNKPIILSAIHHSEKEVKRYEKEARYGIRRVYNFLIPWQSTRDLWKNIYRSVFNHKKAYPTLVQAIKGIRNQQRSLVNMADIILVQTEKEAKDIEKDFQIKDFKWEKVVNGVDVDVFIKATPERFVNEFRKRYGINLKSKRIVLNVGRIEPRKNQLNLIKAFEELQQLKRFKDFKLIFIGPTASYHLEYLLRFQHLVKKNANIFYMGSLFRELLASAMSVGGIYVHPSWFETTGLVLLEASLSGMRTVATGDRTKEYLKENSVYCTPGNINSIKSAILKASKKKGSNERFQREVKEKYSWVQAAKQTIRVYKDILA